MLLWYTVTAGGLVSEGGNPEAAGREGHSDLYCRKNLKRRHPKCSNQASPGSSLAEPEGTSSACSGSQSSQGHCCCEHENSWEISSLKMCSPILRSCSHHVHPSGSCTLSSTEKVPGITQR